MLETLQVAMLILLALCSAIGIWLQFLAWRHLKPGIPRYGHKDSMFKKKQDYYTEQGMAYIRLQKGLMYIMAGLFAVLIFAIEYGAPNPPGH